MRCWPYVMLLPLLVAHAAVADDQALILATSQGGPSDIVVDESHLYWTNRDNGTLMKLAKTGGAAEVLADGQQQIGRLAVDRDYVYWTNGPRIMKQPKAGGAAIVLATTQTRGKRGPAGIAVLGPWVVWAMYFDRDGTIMRADKRGGPSTTLAADQDGAFYLAVDDRALFWTNHSGPGKTVMRLRFDDGKATVFAAGQFNPTYVALDERDVYWTNLRIGTGTVMAKSRAGGAARVLAKDQLGPSALALDDERVYWTSLDLQHTTAQRLAGRSFVLWVAKRGGEPNTLVSADGHFWGLAVDDEFVYWTSFDRGTVSRIRKPSGPRRQ